jgi:pimeloyl-ACP methyl ester carboxylesterase
MGSTEPGEVPIDEGYAEANGLRVFYRALGDGPPLILLHGGLATGEVMWNGRVLAELARGHRVFVPDSRGHGRTHNPSGRMTYAAMADDVAAFAATLEIGRPVILGYSDGAQIAIELGLRHPELASAIVFGGVVTRPAEAYRELLRGMGFTAPGEYDRAQVEEALGSFFPTVRAIHEQARDDAGLDAYLRQIATLWYDVPEYTDEQLGGIATPSLVIVGDRDVPALDESLRLYRLLPRGELAVVPGADHGAGERRLFWDAVHDFLDRQA